MVSKSLRSPLRFTAWEVLVAIFIGAVCGWLVQSVVTGLVPTGVYAGRAQNVNFLQQTPIITGILCSICGLALLRSIKDNFLYISQSAHFLIGVMLLPIFFAYLPPIGCATSSLFVILFVISLTHYQGKKSGDVLATWFIVIMSIYSSYIVLNSFLAFTD